MTSAGDNTLYKNEFETDNALLDILGLGLLPTYQYLHTQKPDFEVFEQWVIAQCGASLTNEKIEQCNALLNHGFVTNNQVSDGEMVLSPEELAFWEEQGYVVVKNAISEEDAAAGRQAIWEYLEMDEHDPATWYNTTEATQGIMVPLYRHPAIDKNRQSPRIKRAFEQIWNQTGLVVTTDKCGFNPPETETFKYKGIGLHWDMSLATPIPFGTQGILYLTDTAPNQGALTLVPGFHKNLENWLQTLPAGTNPRTTDFSPFNPTPITARAGDFIIWNQKLPHSSSPNTASLPRLVQYINWLNPLQEKADIWI